jgi:hypothetical protein
MTAIVQPRHIKLDLPGDRVILAVPQSLLAWAHEVID